MPVIDYSDGQGFVGTSPPERNWGTVEELFFIIIFFWVMPRCKFLDNDEHQVVVCLVLGQQTT